MRVRCHRQPPRLVSLQPGSIQARKPYQAAVLVSGGKSVMSNHSSRCASSHRASNVHATGRDLKAVPVPCQAVPGVAAKVDSPYQQTFPWGRNNPRGDPQQGMPPQVDNGLEQPARIQPPVSQDNDRHGRGYGGLQVLQQAHPLGFPVPGDGGGQDGPGHGERPQQDAQSDAVSFPCF